MFKKLFAFAVLPLLAISSFLSANVQYDIHDIDTLQTHSSEAIALNNNGQILGWYNIDGSKEGKHFFLRDRDGNFHEVPATHKSGWVINWQYLTDNGNVYGTFDGTGSFPVLMVWDQQNGLVKVGTLPGKEISAINNSGQVLIKSFTDNNTGKIHPVIWHNNQITKLKGLEGDFGIESDESYGFDMNNKGEVVGQSLTSLVYKNNIYYQIHAVKWVDGQAVDLHNTVPKTDRTYASAINDNGNVLINRNLSNSLNNIDYLFTEDQVLSAIFKDGVLVGFNGGRIASKSNITGQLQKDYDSLWLSVVKFISINDNGEIIAEGKTIYGEKHAMLLTPASSSN